MSPMDTDLLSAPDGTRVYPRMSMEESVLLYSSTHSESESFPAGFSSTSFIRSPVSTGRSYLAYNPISRLALYPMAGRTMLFRVSLTPGMSSVLTSMI